MSDGIFNYDHSDHVRPAGESQRAQHPAAAPSEPATGDDPNNSRPVEKRVGAEGYQADKDKRAAPPRTEEGELGDGLSPEQRAHREALREENPFIDPTKMYNNLGLEETVVDLTGEDREKVLGETKRMLWDFQLSEPEAKDIIGLVQRHEREPVDDETHARWYAESANALIRKYGAEEANKMVIDAKAFLRAFPAQLEILEKNRLTSHPRVVAKIVDLARQARIKGRLK